MITLSHYRGKTLAVFGFGKAGVATVASLLAGGVKVLAWDDHETSIAEAAAKYPTASFLPPAQWNFHDISFLVLSPGVPLTHPKPHPVVVMASHSGCPVLGDIELLAHACPKARMIGITGTNGKSTTTTLIGHILKTAGEPVQVGGNLGTPALALEPLEAEGSYVLELSSYQLDLLHRAKFHVACLTNITPDHLDRHGGMEGYIASKMKIFDRQHPSDAAIVAVDDAFTQHIHHLLLQQKIGRVITVSTRRPMDHGIFVQDGVLMDKLDPHAPFNLDLKPIVTLTGRHNWQNAAVAYAAARLHGLKASIITMGLQTYPGLKHRLELVSTIRGVRFINDSKATNADATSNALTPYQNIYWILGGKAKEGGIASLEPYFSNIAHAFLIGEAASEFAQTLSGKVPYTQCGTLARAVEQASIVAFREGRKDAVVLLSPACASFDQWKNFEERGEAFCRLVQELKVVA